MIRVETAKLVQLLGDLAHTSGEYGATAGILVHTARGYRGDEPGQMDLLVGTSTNGWSVGHSYVASAGQEPAPMLWPIADARAVIASYKPRLKDNKDHAVEIRRDGNEIVVSEDPNLFGDGLTLRFTEGDLGKYPRNVFAALSDVHLRPGDDFEVARPRTDFTAAQLAPFVAVAKAHSAPVELYRYHQKMPALVQIGWQYRGLLATTHYPDDSDAAAVPSADVYACALPEPEEDQADDDN